jgi:hypothetical protein
MPALRMMEEAPRARITLGSGGGGGGGAGAGGADSAPLVACASSASSSAASALDDCCSARLSSPTHVELTKPSLPHGPQRVECHDSPGPAPPPPSLVFQIAASDHHSANPCHQPCQQALPLRLPQPFASWAQMHRPVPKPAISTNKKAARPCARPQWNRPHRNDVPAVARPQALHAPEGGGACCRREVQATQAPRRRLGQPSVRRVASRAV